MKTICKLIIPVTILCFVLQLNAQKSPAKFGKIDKKYLEMESCEFDTSASAVVLMDFGKTYFTYTANEGFKISMERHTIIKILKKDGYEWADVQVPVYHNESSNELVSNLKGRTYNLKKGKMVTDKLSKDGKFKEELNEYWDYQKFTMPNVKEGSVIEYSYTITSDFLFNLRDWSFQHSIPVLWSEYVAIIPEYFYYKQFAYGFEPFFIRENYTVMEQFRSTLEHTAADRSNFGMSPMDSKNVESSTFDVTSNLYRFVAKDVPALKDEPYTTTIDNYTLRMEFELASVQYPNQAPKNYTQSWESINERLLESTGFGEQLNKGFLEDKTNEVIAGKTEDIDKALAIYDYVRTTMNWDGYHSKYVKKSLRDAYKQKSGNVSDVNLMVVVMLNEAGLKAYPIVISTRDNGILHPSHPVLTKFNYVIAAVEVEEKTFMLDATEPLCPADMLPYRCLNGKGRIVNERKAGWIDVKTGKSDKNLIYCDITIDEGGVFYGTYDIKKDGYSALQMRKRFKSEIDEEDYIEEIEKNNPGLTIVEFSFQNMDSIYKPVEASYEIEIEDKVDMIGDIIYFNPMLFDQMTKNVFKLEERKFPVDFGYPIDENYIMKLEIPDGYVVEDLPENALINLPNGGGKFIYNVTQIGNSIQVMSRYTINQTIFVSEEYPIIREFYQQIIEKHAQQISIIKKS